MYNANKKLNKCCDVNLRQNRWKQYGKTTLTQEKKSYRVGVPGI